MPFGSNMFGHNVGLPQASRTAQQLSSLPRRSGSVAEVRELESMVQRQNLIIQALLTVMIEKGQFTEDEFRQCMDAVDMLDGAADGKLKEDNSPVSCPGCNRINKRTAKQCQYCGQVFETNVLRR